jgi:predicted nucleotidyltransferase component of viral defense system
MSDIEKIEFLHVMTLDALCRTKVGTDGSLLFMGGTSLKLAYGSPRWSEDLDFLAVDGTRLEEIMLFVLRRVSASTKARFGMEATLHGGNPEKNPVKFAVRVRGANPAEPSLRVKCEFHRVAAEILSSWDSRQARISSPFVPTVSAVVNTASLTEIFAEKLHSVGGRRALKERDLFDIAWIAGQQGENAIDREVAYRRAEEHLSIYPTKAGCSESVEVGIERVSGIAPERLATAISTFISSGEISMDQAGQIKRDCLNELRTFSEWLDHQSEQQARPTLRAIGM